MSLLADDFFCLALDEHSGRMRLAPRVAGVALASALLGEIVLSGHAVVQDGFIEALNVQRPPDPLARRLHELLLARPQHRDLGIWLSFVARDAVSDVAARVAATGVVTPIRKRGLTGTRTLYEAVDRSAVAWPGIRIASSLSQGEAMSLQDVACVGLAVAADLIGHLLWDPEVHRPARANLPNAIAALPPPLTSLLSRTETAVGDAVLTSRA